jgi:hypothetical protein
MMERSYNRTAQKLLEGVPATKKPYCKVINGRLVVGVRTTHKSSYNARMWNLFWRLKFGKKTIALVSFNLEN